MNKKVVALLLALPIALTACGADEDKTDESKEGRFSKIEEKFSYSIIIDNETGVEYIRTSYGGFSPLYNPDGTLKTEVQR